MILKIILSLILSVQILSADTQDSVISKSPWNSKAWLKLLHYSNNKSRIVDPSFFISKQGKTDAKEEFLLTYQAILSNQLDQEGTPYACKYPARALFIENLLRAENKNYSAPNCPRFEKWSKAINAKSITLIFPSAFLNNPASMFGHTLLRIDTPDQDENTRMLAYTVNFAAHTEGEGALVYALKGLLGGFYGFFSVAPYYEKIKKYSDLESRDIWEYEIALKDEEIKMLVAHLWELRDIPFYYYYFDENCSYQLLALLEAVSPELKLTENFYFKAIPVDTVKAVINSEGLLKNTYYRPSNVSRLKTRIKDLDTSLQKQSIACTDNCELADLTTLEKAKVLDLAHDFLDYQRLKTKGDVSKKEARLLELLSARSKLSISDSTVAELIKNPAIDPAKSHGTLRTSLLAGRFRQENYLDFEFRPAYHDLLDSLSGYQKGAGIDFLDLGLRYYEDSGLSLNKFKLLNIDSISEQDLFFKPLSWHFETGLVRKNFEDNNKLEYLNTLAVGISKKVQSFTVSLLPEVSIALSKHYKETIDLQPGLRFGVLSQKDSALSLHPSFHLSWATLDSTDFMYDYRLPLNYALSDNSSVRIEFERKYADTNSSNFRAGVNFYW